MTDPFDEALAVANAAPSQSQQQPPSQPVPQAEAPPASPADAAAPRGASWDAARRAARQAAARPLPAAHRPLVASLGRTLAEPLTALTDLPAHDASAMDGWAVAGPGPWALTPGAGTLAGHAPAEALSDGQAVPVATGARLPAGATAVLRTERGAVAGGQLRGPAPKPGADIRPRASECRTGTALLPAGTEVTPAVLGLAASAGYDELLLHRRPRAEVWVLGDELLTGGLPRDGLVRDALGPMTGPWLAALGADVQATRHLGDDADALHDALTTTRADLVVTTGGTAAGPVDHVRPALERAGARLHVEGVAVRPGHPMVLAELPDGAALVGLPGNPLAAVAGLLTLAAPLLRALSGRPEPPEPRATLTEPVTAHPADTRLVPVSCPRPGSAAPLRYAGPAMLRGVATAAALAVVPPDPGPQSGAVERVRLLELPRG